MKFIKQKLNIVTSIITILTLIIVFAWNTTPLQAHYSVQRDERVISSATIDDDFVDDTVVIVFNIETSFQFNTFSPSDFPEVRVRSIENVNENVARMVQNQVLSEARGKTFESDRLINHETFRRVIALRLYDNCKQGVLDAVRLLEQRNDVISASPSMFGQLRTIPNDPGFNDPGFDGNRNGVAQWGLNGSYGIEAPGAWSIARGSSEVIVGIIDSGIRSTHQDLRGRVDYNLSRDFTQDNPVGHVPIDTNGHGTHIAGVIGARTNTTPATGMAGVRPVIVNSIHFTSRF